MMWLHRYADARLQAEIRRLRHDNAYLERTGRDLRHALTEVERHNARLSALLQHQAREEAK